MSQQETTQTPPPVASTGAPAPVTTDTPPPVSRPPAGSIADVIHPRGRIRPPLGLDAPRWRRIGRALFRLGQGLYYHDVFQVAPAMAFHFFLSLLPLLVFVGYVLGLVAERKGVSTVLGLFLDNLPQSTETVLKTEVQQLASADRVGPIALIGFFWIASGGIHGLMDAIERVVGAQPRAWWRKRALALGWVVATLAAFGVASYLSIEWDSVAHAPPTSIERAGDAPASADPMKYLTPLRPPPSFVMKHPRLKVLRSSGERALTIGVSLSIAIFGLAAFYRFAVAHSRRVKRRVLPGAVVAVALWIVVSWGFGVYVQSLTNYTVYYGSLAAVAVLLVWLWLVSIAMLIGAELNSQLEGLRDALVS